MTTTVIHLPDDLRLSLRRKASAEQRSEQEIIQEAVRAAVAAPPRIRPRLPLFERGTLDPTAAERVDELLEGFGEP
jgi:hypothetical protein